MRNTEFENLLNSRAEVLADRSRGRVRWGRTKLLMDTLAHHSVVRL